MSISQYQRGSTVRLKVNIYDASGALYDPDTSVKVSVTDPDGTEKLTATDMTKESTGKYYYDWQTASDYTIGAYKQKVTSVDGSKTSIEIDDAAFILTDK